MVLRQLRQLSIAEVGRQRPAAALPDHGPIQPEANFDRVHLEGLLHQHQEGALLRFFHAGIKMCLRIFPKLKSLLRTLFLCSLFP